MKAYILKEEDLDHLLAIVDRDPEYGAWGGSSSVLSEEDRRVYRLAHRHYNYMIRSWIDSVKK